MKIGQTVWFQRNESVNEFASYSHIVVGQVIGIYDNGNTVGEVPEDVTSDGVNVKVASFANLWVGRSEGVHKLDKTLDIAKATYKLLGVEWGPSVSDKTKPSAPVSFAQDDNHEDHEEEVCSGCGWALNEYGHCPNEDCDQVC